jgi:hypothetical protein
LLPTAVDHRGEQRRLLHREGPERQALAHVYFEDEPGDVQRRTC